MEFLTRVLSGNSRLKERAREAEPVNQAFKENLDNLKRLLESEESDDISALLDMVYESSFPEEQVFMKTPSRARLKSKKELVVRLLIGLDSLGVPAMAEMLVFVRKHGPEGVADSLMTLLEFMSPLLAGKEAPVFSTDDVVDAMDFEWHSTSRTGSPLLNVIASVTSSPRASTASVGDSPLHPSISASPYRRAFSERSMLVSRANELGAKSVLDKTSTASRPPQKMMSANQGFRSSELTILETPASLDITQVSAVEQPSSYSLDTLPESGLQRRHRRKSSSLQQLFVEDGIEELSNEGSVGASSKRHSSSSSWQRNSSEFTKIITNTSEASSPLNPGLAADDNREGVTVAPDKTFLSTIYTQDRHVNGLSQKGSRRISPSPPDEVALWREDSGGFSVDLVSSDKNAAQNSVGNAEHGIPLTQLLLEAEVCPRGVEEDDSLKPDEQQVRSQSHIRDGVDVKEDARHAQSSQAHEEDARLENFSLDYDDQDAAHAHSSDTHEDDTGCAHTRVQSSSDDHMEVDVHSSCNSDEDAGHGYPHGEENTVHVHTHEKDARHTCSSDICEENVGYTHMFDLEEDRHESISDKITTEGNSQEGYGFQGILSPLLLPSSSNVCQDVNDKDNNISSFSEVSLEEILQSKDDRSLKQEALEMKDGTSPAKEVNAHTSFIEEVVNSSLDIDSENHSTNENINLEMPQLMREVENVQALDVHGDNVARSHALAEHLKVNDDQCEKLLSELDAIEGELPLTNDIEGGQMGMYDDKMEEKNQEEDSALGLDKEKMQLLDEKMGIIDESAWLMKENSEKEFLDDGGHFIMGAGESTPFLHVYNPEEGHVMASTSKECGGLKEARMVCEEANSKLDQDKQYGLECPMMGEDALQGGEVSKPNSWEASEDVDSHPLHDKDHIHCQSLAQILDASSAVQSTETGHTDQLAVQFTDVGMQCELFTQVVDGRQFTDSGMQCELLTQVVDARQFTDSGTQCELLTQVVDASESQPLYDVNHYIERPAVYFTEPYAGSPSHKSASQSTMSGTAAQSTDTESDLQVPGSGMHHAPTTQVADVSESQPVHEDDYVQRPPAQFTEPYASESQPLHEDDYIQRPPAQFTEPYAAALHDHEHQNADHLSHVFPVSNNPPYALPHGQPTFLSTSGDGESQQRVNQQPASGPTTMDRWDSDTKVPRYKWKGNSMGKMKCGYLSCCTRPPTNS